MRKLWLNTTGLAATPTGQLDILQIIKDLGFVQLDTIQNVSRAHHHILWSRNQNYREPMLDKLLKSKGNVFEHFTHDASVIPVEFYPMWTRQFGRIKKYFDNKKYYKMMTDDNGRTLMKERIKNTGPLSTHAFDTKIEGKKEMWTRPPHKLALDYMWYCGELSTSHRENFSKYYDLTENIIPENMLKQNIEEERQIHWLCQSALDRLSFGNIKDIRNFWQATDTAEVQNWIQKNKKYIMPIKWQTANNQWIDGYVPTSIEEQITSLNKPTSRMRIINPFDPAVRDRARLKDLFGFDYKIEIFVPKAKRRWGYYVYPLLEGDRFVGRIEIKADRKSGTLNVINFWHEETTNWSNARRKKLDAELLRLARFVNLDQINWL